MANRKPYEHRVSGVSWWTLKAIGLVAAGAATVIAVLTVAKGVSTKSDPAQGGKYVGVRHEAATITPTADKSGVSKSGSNQVQDSSATTVVRNGVTVVSPQLLVPVIDMASLQTANASGDNVSASKTSDARKRSRYVNRSRSQRQTRWTAFGLANR